MNDAIALHNRSIVIDGLCASRLGSADVYRHLHEGGVTAVNVTLALWEGAQQTMQTIGRMYRDFEIYKEWIRPITSIEDIHAAKRENRVGIIFGFQNASPLEGDLDMVEVYYRLGVRVIQITYNDLNYVGAGCYERRDHGLSQFGIDLLCEMNRLGMVVDLSHVGDQTTMDAIEVSRQPVWISHANPRVLKDHPRNKTDEQVQALVAKGGVIGANIFPPFFARGYDATLEDFLDVLNYWISVAGIDHVALGLDFTENQSQAWADWMMKGKRREAVVPLEMPLKMPEGIARADEMPNITAGLLRRGYTEIEVQKILGFNVLHLFENIWKDSAHGGETKSNGRPKGP